MSRSPTAAMMENCIYRKTHRKKRKPELNPSDIPTYDPIWPLLSKRWLRVRARTRA